MVVRSGLITVAVMGALSLVSGLGWGWVANLGTPGHRALVDGPGHRLRPAHQRIGPRRRHRGRPRRRAHADPGHRPAGRGRHRRLLPASTASASGCSSALGITMMAFVLLGPVVQPWYLTWGIIIVAPVVTGRCSTSCSGLSTVAPFIGLTGGTELLNELVHTDPVSMVLAVMVLWAVAIFPLGNWTTSWRLDRSRLPGALGAPRPERRARVLSPRADRAAAGPATAGAGARPRRATGGACAPPPARRRPARSRPPGAGRWRSRCARRCGR